MKIKKIKLKNIRSHKESLIELEEGISVFTGRTGSGKSSVLVGIEYALFGSDINLSNKDILRRNKQKGFVELEFEQDGDIYNIKRGLKRTGKMISVDSSELSITKNEKLLPIIGRAGDLDSRILEVLNYPKGVKAKEIFEITSYTKQDEIRVLIEMSAEKRQEYLDKILQLSKYKTTWENMKDVVSHFKMEAVEIKGNLENFEKIKNEKVEIEDKIKMSKNIIDELNNELKNKKDDVKKIKENISELENERDVELKKRRKYDEFRGSLSNLKDEKEKLDNELANTKKEIEEIKEKIKSDVPELEKLKEEKIENEKTIELLEKEKIELDSEFKEIKRLGKGKCPVCKQEITENHLENLNDEFDNKKDVLENKISKCRERVSELNPKIELANEQKKLGDKLNLMNEKQKEYEKRLEENKKEIEDLESKEIKFDNKYLESIESKLKEIKQSETEITSKIESISKEISLRNDELEDKKNELESKKKQIIEFGKKEEKIKKLNSTIDLLLRMREDIRNIREVVRRRFLEDFRQEFQKKFEEIRKYEEEYTVDVKSDYEPVAFSSDGEEVPISSLSGGEKTSVALSYRLALADIAAQISDIRPSELLILDEPTTGFDKEDIKALPEALKNIKTIPQIIIVSHEEELKNAADYKFEVSKEQNISNISRIE